MNPLISPARLVASPRSAGILESGLIALVNGQSYIDVVFPAPLPGTTWNPLCSVLNAVDATPLNIWPGIVSAKSTLGFTVQLNGIPDSGNYYLYWSIAPGGVMPDSNTYTLSGPSAGPVGVASTNFTVALPVGGGITGTMTVTPSDGGGGGTLTPATVNLTTVAPSATFTYTPSVTPGTRTISVTNNKGLTNPGNLSYVASVPFDPTTIAGLKLWLKADAIAGPPADGTLLSAWNDSSVTGYNLGNAGGSERPTFKTNIVNGKPVVRFDGVANRLYASSVEGLSQPYTIFVVGNSTTLNDCRFVQTIAAGAVMLMALDSVGGYIEIYAGAGGGFLKASSPVDQHGAFHQWTAIFNSTTSSIYGDGSLVVTGDSGTNGLGALGVMTDGISNSVHSAGDIAEILIYNSALGTTDRQSVELYLKNKYGL